MISVKHPDINIEQQKIIDSLPKTEKRAFVLLCSYTNAVYRYYNDYIEPTEQKYKEWLKSLEESFKDYM